jgi:hypothetical protein
LSFQLANPADESDRPQKSSESIEAVRKIRPLGTARVRFSRADPQPADADQPSICAARNAAVITGLFHVNVNYWFYGYHWCRLQESNPRPTDYKFDGLTFPGISGFAVRA